MKEKKLNIKSQGKESQEYDNYSNGGRPQEFLPITPSNNITIPISASILIIDPASIEGDGNEFS